MAKSDTMFTVTLPDGTIATRTSPTRTYTHATITWSKGWAQSEESWGVLRWSASLGNAASALRSFQKDAPRVGWHKLQVVPVIPAWGLVGCPEYFCRVANGQRCNDANGSITDEPHRARELAGRKHVAQLISMTIVAS